MRLWFPRLCVALALSGTLCAAFAESPEDYRGLWFDRARSGHGLDVHAAGDGVFALIYTYDRAGEPTWYVAQQRPQGTFDSPVYRFQRGADGIVGAGRVVGRLTMQLNATTASVGCNDGVPRPGAKFASLALTIDGEHVDWCLEPVATRDPRGEGSLSGLWWAGAPENGWGMGALLLPDAAGHRLVSQVYHYDASGEPRWVVADSTSASLFFDAPAFSLLGYCRSCAPTAPVFRPAGRLRTTLSTPRVELDLGNRIRTELVYPAGVGGDWIRDRGIGLISLLPHSADAAPTREGLVEGRQIAGTPLARIFEGIPFAAPPLGELRWRAPDPPAPRDRVLRNTALAPACPQLPGPGFFGVTPPVLDEDCLYLNVWSTDLAPATLQPVMVWIHGGGLVQGGASQIDASGMPSYDGAALARRGIVLVTINYRLGGLGFTVFNDLIDENPAQPGAGNYGFLDQVAALAWVRDNIAAFGGDPARVTIFGESAGGTSVCGHMASALSRGLFHGAIVQSSNCRNTLPALRTSVGNQEAAIAQGERLKQRTGCTVGNVRACLRSKSADAILSAANAGTGFSGVGEPYGLVQDGFAFTQSPGDALRRGDAAPVPFIIGVNEDEATTLLPASEKPTTLAGYEALVRSRLPTIAGQVLARYPGTQVAPVWRAWASIVTDTSFICPSARAARDHAAAGNATYAYYFTHVLPTPQLAPLGAFHAIEIPFLFSPLVHSGAAEQTLAANMQSLWSSFAADGVPDAMGIAMWPQHPATGASGLELNGAAIAPRGDYRKSFCDFWAQYLDL